MSASTEEVKRVFDQAADLASDDREAYLDETCAGRQELRLEVETLLAAMEQGSAFMAGAKLGERVRSSTSRAEQPGDVIGRYRLVRLIGQGGFGRVFEAEQQRPVKRRVALKIIKLGMDTEQVIARFEAERQALAMMDHPSIARVLDAGATDTGRPYFVMELVEGDPITSFAQRQSLTTRDRLDLFLQVCRAVQHAHSKGVIHRDLKPSNVLVTEIDGRPVPKIIDFGIAKAVAGRLTDRTLLTEARQLVGTPEYMSPEQAAGASDDIDTRSDVYGLGVLLYELLTGVPPMDPQRLRSATWDEMLRIIREEEPARPSTRLSTIEREPPTPSSRTPAPRVAPSLRGDLDWIVMKCLEKDRARRYETADALAADIARHLAGEPVLAAPPSRAYRLRKLVSRHRGPVAAGAAIALVLLLGIIGTGAGLAWALREADRADARAADLQDVVEFQADQLQRLRPEDIAPLLRTDLVERFDILAQLDGLTGEEIDDARTYLDRLNYTDVSKRVIYETILEPSIGRIDEQFADRPLDQARLLGTIGGILLSSEMTVEAEVPLRRALQIRQDVLGKEHPDTLTSLRVVAEVVGRRGNGAMARELSQEALRTARRVLQPDDDRLARFIFTAANWADQASDFDVAIPLWEELLDVVTRNDADDAGMVMWATSQFALGLRDREPERSERLLRETLDYYRTHDMSQEWVLFQLALQIIRHRDGRDDSQWLERLDEAESLLRESLQIWIDTRGQAPQWTSSTRRWLVGCLRQKAQVTGERAPLEEARRICEELILYSPPDSPGVIRVFVKTLIDLGEFEEALEQMREFERRVKSKQWTDAKTPEQHWRQSVAPLYVRLYEAWDAAHAGIGMDVEADRWRAIAEPEEADAPPLREPGGP